MSPNEKFVNLPDSPPWPGTGSSQRRPKTAVPVPLLVPVANPAP